MNEKIVEKKLSKVELENSWQKDEWKNIWQTLNDKIIDKNPETRENGFTLSREPAGALPGAVASIEGPIIW